MGAESYFVLLIADGVKQEVGEYGVRSYVGESNISRSQLESYFESEVGIDISNQHILEGILELAINTDKNDKIKTVSIEGCFFHFIEGLELIFQLYEKIKKHFCFKLFHPGTGYLDHCDKDLFIQKVKGFYDNKYNDFVRDFGVIDDAQRILPNGGFVKYLENSKKFKLS